MWMLAALLGNDLSDPQVLNKIHELLYLWPSNDTKKKKKGKSSSSKLTSKKVPTLSVCMEDFTTCLNSQHLLNSIIRAIANQLRDSRSHVYKMTSQDTLKVLLHSNFNFIFLYFFLRLQ